MVSTMNCVLRLWTPSRVRSVGEHKDSIGDRVEYDVGDSVEDRVVNSVGDRVGECVRISVGERTTIGGCR